MNYTGKNLPTKKIIYVLNSRNFRAHGHKNLDFLYQEHNFVTVRIILLAKSKPFS